MDSLGVEILYRVVFISIAIVKLCVPSNARSLMIMIFVHDVLPGTAPETNVTVSGLVKL